MLEEQYNPEKLNQVFNLNGKRQINISLLQMMREVLLFYVPLSLWKTSHGTCEELYDWRRYF